MPKFNVSADLLVPVLVEIEAEDEIEAEEKFYEMPKVELLRLANSEESSLDICDNVFIERSDND